MEYILIGIIIIALLAYVSVILYQRRNSKAIDQLQTKEQSLNDIPVKQTLNEVRKMKLAGQSMTAFQKWEKAYQKLSHDSIAKMDQKLLAAETANNHYHFFEAQKLINGLKQELDDLRQQLNEILAGFQQLKKRQEKNQEQEKTLEATYQKLRKQLLTKSFAFGTATEQLEAKLSYLENAHNKFAKLAKHGDHVEAEGVLKQLDKDTTELNDLMTRIPPRYKEIKTEFPDQLRELRNGYEQLAQQRYAFYDINIPDELDQLDHDISATNDDFATLDLTKIEAGNKAIEQRIDHLYDVIEAEMSARQQVEKDQADLEEFIMHAKRQSHALLIELDHLDQSYHLTHNEITDAEELKKQIDEIEVNFAENSQKISDHKAVYSMVADDFKNAFTVLTNIEEKQKSINTSVQGLRKGEQEAQKSLQSFEFEIRNIKRQVEKLRLPGLAKPYLDFFFVVTDEINQLADDLNQVKINLDDITKQLIATQEDLNKLKEETNDLIDSALLTEQLLQYSNRYRHSHAEVAQAGDQAFQIFNQQYEYKQALETIATELEKVEPGSYKKVEDSYYSSKQDDLLD
ncbi:septation ring formation regulator EzrA [Loigolactobacillus backii]|uniref:Septation ring formation regulator EzrA n=1 Tax=Loigolactobacillus backii TaxID=375175 RepID=A0A192H2X8_9LACO|nr:septation ring formation regulator EzrA [Loigolactobacillus backii]ANK59767.1 selenide, water dikinase [Loigolactobacillus backii]ANK63169.1 selenide, water dikinase [Loigolactobacillus backii]ANK64762.1 selenide, water dikinase [Loigolactobacillus backii]ANK66789.1 selenide, water dikinase [Loigolactobacillus backii]ANK69825.1 selenide, water dikinase [Loigolactobacillus backii]